MFIVPVFTCIFNVCRYSVHVCLYLVHVCLYLVHVCLYLVHVCMYLVNVCMNLVHMCTVCILYNVHVHVQAMYLGPNIPHAYIAGDCIECMANRDLSSVTNIYLFLNRKLYKKDDCLFLFLFRSDIKKKKYVIFYINQIEY